MSPMNQFGLPDHLRRLSATGGPLEALERAVDFERFRGSAGGGSELFGPCAGRSSSVGPGRDVQDLDPGCAA